MDEKFSMKGKDAADLTIRFAWVEACRTTD